MPTLVAPERVDVRRDLGMDELARIACARYGRPADGALHRYPLTGNWTYRAGGEAGAPGVLRTCRPGGRSPAEILSEPAWMEALHIILFARTSSPD